MLHQKWDLRDLYPGLDTAATLTGYARPRLGTLADDGDRWAVLILPGGGYEVVAPTEGEPVALAFLAQGIQAFVLEYSVGSAHWPAQLVEAAGALHFIRANHEKFGVAPDHIAVCGFSAGGHLAGCLANLWGHPVIGGALGLSPAQVRPDAAILSYPVITAVGPFACSGCFTNLVGPGVAVPPELSLEESVTAANPPAFLWATVTDSTVPVENTIAYAATLRAAGVPFELHLFADGPHAMGLATGESVFTEPWVNHRAAGWHDLACSWLKSRVRKEGRHG